MADSLALELKGITKTFGSTVANKDVDLQVRNGEILSILGENGSGKTTLMNMVSGIYFPDSGKIFVNGREVVIRSPKDAFDLKIGMIHQHFKLVDVFDAVQNIVLGVNDGEKYNLKKAEERVKAITDKYGFVIDLNKKVYEMSVSEKQTVEIIKVLYRGADILILDEPTAVLTPQETEKLFDVLRKMREDNKSIIIITHKLHEVLEISDRVTILRKGEYVDTVETKDATEQSLTEMMMGEKVSLNITRNAPKNPEPRIVVEKLSVKDHEGKLALDNVSFTANSGEILGIAGISGCGQKELLEAIAGLQQSVKGSSIIYKSKDGEESQLVGREIASNPTVLMVAYPVRGLDINSSYLIYDLLNKQKEQGVSVIFVGEDLDVLIELCDRIMVINSGKITGIVDGPTAKKDEIGLLMTKSTEEREAE